MVCNRHCEMSTQQPLFPFLFSCRTWVACRSSRQLVTQSCPTVCDPMDCNPPGCSVRGILQARILEWEILVLRIFLTQGSNLGLLHCRQILYQLSHQGCPSQMVKNLPMQKTQVWGNSLDRGASWGGLGGGERERERSSSLLKRGTLKGETIYYLNNHLGSRRDIAEPLSQS